MGDMADYNIECGMDQWIDHLAGHPTYPDECPYCAAEYERDKNIEKEKT